MNSTENPSENPPGEQPVEVLSASTCLELLRTAEYGRLAVRTPDDGVDIFPVNFIVDHGSVVFRTAPGTKLHDLRLESKVAFEADRFDWSQSTAWSVVVKGRAALVDARDDLFDLFELELETWHSSHKAHFVRLEPDLITGRRFVRPTPTPDPS